MSLFMRGGCGLSLRTLDKLGELLGLKLVTTGRKAKKGKVARVARKAR